MRFSYRATEPLLRVLEQDALSHLLALRYFVDLFDEHFDGPSQLYGAYPGVDIVDPESGARVGEADVVLLFTNGQLVVGECKRRAAGLTEQELAQFDQLARQLGAEWSFVATPEPASRCGTTWHKAIAGLPTPRFVLTGEHLLDRSVFWELGKNPLAWREDSTNDWVNLATRFVDDLPRLIKWLDDRHRGVIPWLEHE